MTNKLSDMTKRRFIRDFNLPIPVLDEPYFSHYLYLCDSSHNSVELHELLLDAVTQHGSEELFFKYQNKILKEIKSAIMSTDKWGEFEQERIVSNLDQGIGWQKCTLYQREFAGLEYVSLDMKKANFQALRFISKSLVLGADSYKDLLSLFTDNEYLHRSKMYRQVIFGGLLPKKQDRIQRYLMLKVYHALKSIGLDMEQVYSASNDELVIRVVKGNELDLANKVRNSFLGDIDLTVEKFTLEHIHPIKSFFAKRYENNEFTLKKVEAIFAPEVLRHMKGEGPNSHDRLFVHDGRVAQFNTPLYEVSTTRG